jgi:hypothetical protein
MFYLMAIARVKPLPSHSLNMHYAGLYFVSFCSLTSAKPVETKVN